MPPLPETTVLSKVSLPPCSHECLPFLPALPVRLAHLLSANANGWLFKADELSSLHHVTTTYLYKQPSIHSSVRRTEVLCHGDKTVPRQDVHSPFPPPRVPRQAKKSDSTHASSGSSRVRRRQSEKPVPLATTCLVIRINLAHMIAMTQTIFGQCDPHDLCFESLLCAFGSTRELRICLRSLFCPSSFGGVIIAILLLRVLGSVKNKFHEVFRDLHGIAECRCTSNFSRAFFFSFH